MHTRCFYVQIINKIILEPCCCTPFSFYSLEEEVFGNLIFRCEYSIKQFKTHWFQMQFCTENRYIHAFPCWICSETEGLFCNNLKTKISKETMGRSVTVTTVTEKIIELNDIDKPSIYTGYAVKKKKQTLQSHLGLAAACFCRLMLSRVVMLPFSMMGVTARYQIMSFILK